MALGIQHRHLETAHLMAIAIRRYLGELGARIYAFHRGENTRGRDKVAAPRKEVHEAGKAACNDHRETLLRSPVLHAADVHRCVGQAELDHCLAQEGALLFIGVIQGHRPGGFGDGNRNAGQASARADISKRAATIRQFMQHGERIQQVMAHRLQRIADRGEVVNLVPLREQVQIGH